MKPVCFLLLFFSISFLSMNCRKSKTNAPVELPPITQEGKNTFGCKVDGQVWIPYFKCAYMGNPCGEMLIDIYKFNLSSQLPIQMSLSFGLSNGDKKSFFQIDTKQGVALYEMGEKRDSVIFQYSTSGFAFYRNVNSNGSFEITKLDTVNKIISGVFEFVLYDNNNGNIDSVSITDGRFDLKFSFCKCSNP